MECNFANDLITKIRQLNSIFEKSTTEFLPLDALCKELSDIIESNIYVFTPDGVIIAYAIARKFVCPYSDANLFKNTLLPAYYLYLFRSCDTTIFSRYEDIPSCTYADVEECLFRRRYYSLYPIHSNNVKSAGMLLIRYGSNFVPSDTVLCEYASAIVSLWLMHEKQIENQQRVAEMESAQLASKALSFSELQAANTVMQELESEEGHVFFNLIAAKAYVTQSIVTSALKKLESAGVIQTQVHGAKGKSVRVSNPYLKQELSTALREHRRHGPH